MQYATIPLLLASVLVVACSSDSNGGPGNTGCPQGAPCPISPPACDASAEVLQFDLTEGEGDARLENHFYRQGAMATHLVVRQGHSPRVLFAFPANNTGAGIWFEPLDAPAKLTLAGDGKVGCVADANGMLGMSAHLTSDAKSLKVHGVVLGNVRSLRDYGYNGLQLKPPIPPGMIPEITAGPPVIFRRTMTDGKHHAELSFALEDGTMANVQGSDVTFTAGPHGEIHLLATATMDEKPLTPYALSDLVNDRAANDPDTLKALAFLTYKEKLLAGSWRFLTYFGRDTLLSVSMLMPVLKAPVIETGLGAVIERLAPEGTAEPPSGDVAHEEAIGDYAALANVQANPKPADLEKPIYDYKMIDDDFELSAVVVRYCETQEGSSRAGAFLNMKTSAGETYASALKRNLGLVLDRARPYAANPSATNLVKIRDTVNGQPNHVGNWRDSDNGLGQGRYPFDVNVALVPAALQAAASLYARPEIADTAHAKEAQDLLAAWQGVEQHFRVSVPLATAKQRVTDYAQSQGLDPARTANVLTEDPVVYHALSLDAAGKPVEVMHSDAGFAMLFTDPQPATLDLASLLLRPFPAGLLLTSGDTFAGVVVANPALDSDATRQKLFTPSAYHGTVVWSWQQALLAAGFARQLARTDLPDATHARLKDAQTALWKAISGTAAQSHDELWTFSVEGGAPKVAPFVIPSVDESNAIQLWSTVYLAVKPPQ